MSDAIILSNSELKELTQRAMSRTCRAEDARRARLILLLAEGRTWDEVSEHIDCSRGFVGQLEPSGFLSNALRDSTVGIWGKWPPCSPRNWKHGFWRQHDMHRRVQPPIGARANSERI